jgi:hypothetical protein
LDSSLFNIPYALRVNVWNYPEEIPRDYDQSLYVSCHYEIITVMLICMPGLKFCHVDTNNNVRHITDRVLRYDSKETKSCKLDVSFTFGINKSRDCHYVTLAMSYLNENEEVKYWFQLLKLNYIQI